MSKDNKKAKKAKAVKTLAKHAELLRQEIKDIYKKKEVDPLMVQMLLLLKLISLEAERNPPRETGFVLVRLCDAFQEARKRAEFRRSADKSIKPYIDKFGSRVYDTVHDHYKESLSVLRAHKL